MFRSFKHQLFLSYILVFLILALFFAYVLYHFTVQDLRVDMEQGYATELERVSSELEARLLEFNQIATIIDSNPGISRYNITQRGSAALKAIDELAHYGVGNVFIDRLYLYLPANQSLYSRTGMLSLQALTEQVFRWTQEGRDALAAVFEAPYRSRFAQIEGQMLYLNAEHISKSTGDGMLVLFVLNEASFDNALDCQLIADGGALWLADEQGIICSRGAAFSEADAAAVLSGCRQGGKTLSVGPQQFYAYERSLFGSLRLVGAVPQTQIMSRLNVQIVYVLLVSLCLFCLMALLGTWMTYLHYRPVKKLSEFAGGRHTGPVNEFDTIIEILQTVRQDNRHLTRRHADLIYQMQQSLLTALLRGEVADGATCEAHIAAAGLDAVRAYAVLIIAGPEEAATAAHAQGERFRAIPAEIGQEHGRVIVLLLYAATLEEAIGEMDEALQSAPRLSVSSEHGSPMDLSTAFLEAYIASRHDGEERLRYYTRLQTENPHTHRLDQMARMLYAINEADEPQALRLCDEILSDMLGNDLQPQRLRHSSHQLLSNVMDLMDRIELGIEDIWAHPDIHHTAMEAVSYKTFPHFSEQMRKLVAQLCGLVRQGRSRNQETLKHHVVNFVKQNVANPAFSLQTITDEFGHTIYYWSNFFKDHIGMSYKECLWQYRLKKAKQRLTETDDSLASICDHVGYQDVTSFIRRFKESEGLTPGQYRKMYAGQSKRD